MNNCFRVVVVFLTFVAAGCSGGSSAVVDTLRYSTELIRHKSPTPRLSPDFAYLRLSIAGRVLFLARGSIDPSAQGPVEVWYSSEREVVRLQSGRVVGVVGTANEWRSVLLPALPSWRSLAAQEQFSWIRVRDVMPGYRLGVTDSVVTRLIEPPPKTQLKDIDPKSLTWFEDRIDANGFEDSETLPPAHYAVALSQSVEQVIYGEQCLGPTVCFTWQRWPADQNEKK